ncbi:protease [Rufibacter sp. DG15C]|uniref:M57 family metalloprotease n=1 Tax=Rufibacter sp. DG15C TaxID=1379909 RepID=UPI00078BCC43|nr:M57 family metalloprotease [Rufibacter sp. DG15C]AMM51490.1 protease [Rufibacter sp. DG15C]
MKLTHTLKLAAVALVLGFSSCSQNEEEVVEKASVSKETLAKIYEMGFGTTDVQAVEGGYLVEGDIMLTDAQLNAKHDHKFLRVGETEQYRTTNLVNAGTGRNITLSIDPTLPATYVTALDAAIARYNAQGLLITMSRVASGGEIYLQAAPKSAQYLASAGFPVNGNPHNNIKIATRYIGTNPNQAWFTTILAHEIGHCIGFRHTDYMDRSYSCGGSYTNEGASTVGAIHIPGTPTTADATSWMLACIGSGQNRPFNSNDVTALGYLY